MEWFNNVDSHIKSKYQESYLDMQTAYDALQSVEGVPDGFMIHGFLQHYLDELIKQKGRRLSVLRETNTEKMKQDEIDKLVWQYDFLKKEFEHLKLIKSVLLFNQYHIQILEAGVTATEKQNLALKEYAKSLLEMLDSDQGRAMSLTDIILQLYEKHKEVKTPIDHEFFKNIKLIIRE